MILPYTMICFRKELGVLTDYSKTPENALFSGVLLCSYFFALGIMRFQYDFGRHTA